jgi:hypothetical protein
MPKEYKTPNGLTFYFDDDLNGEVSLRLTLTLLALADKDPKIKLELSNLISSLSGEQDFFSSKAIIVRKVSDTLTEQFINSMYMTVINRMEVIAEQLRALTLQKLQDILKKLECYYSTDRDIITFNYNEGQVLVYVRDWLRVDDVKFENKAAGILIGDLLSKQHEALAEVSEKYRDACAEHSRKYENCGVEKILLMQQEANLIMEKLIRDNARIMEIYHDRLAEISENQVVVKENNSQRPKYARW